MAGKYRQDNRQGGMKNEIRQHREIEIMVEEAKTSNLLNEIKHNFLKQKFIFSV